MIASISSALLLAAFASALPAGQPIHRRDIDTRNDLLDGICRPITVIFARGTIELGNVGLLVGPPFFDALSDTIGSSTFAVQGVDYPASIAGYLEGGDPGGSATLASLTNLAASQCPTSQIVLSGYSQGAQLVHNGAAQLSDDVASHVAAVVLFGDPDDGQPFADIPTQKVDTFCFSTDLICKDLPIVDPQHLGYALDAPQAAQFVADTVSIPAAAPTPTPRSLRRS